MTTVESALQIAIAHQQAGRLAKAEEVCRRILAQLPRHAQTLHLLGYIQLLKRRYAEAVETLGQAVAADPRKATLHNDLGEALRGTGQFDQAQACYKRSIQLNPNLAKSHLNLGRVLRIKVEHADAVAEFRRAIELDPDNHDAHHNLGCVLLTQGDFEQGWREYQWRTRAPDHPSTRTTLPRWDGRPLPGKRLEVHAEQGIGDTLNFIRYLPLIEQRVGEIVSVVHPEAIPVLTCSGFRNLVSTRVAAGTCDAQIPLLDLPGLLGTRIDTVPADIPYLRADPSRVEQWRDRLPPADGLRVGIAWQGNKGYYLDRYRSIPLAEFAPLARLPNVQLLSLQKGDAAEDLRGTVEALNLVQFGDELDAAGGAFMDTAAIMVQLDLVITSDTSVAHLAGALGVPVWVALGASPDWRWMLGRDDSPWYPTMRLFRASRVGQWSDVFDRIAKALSGLKQDPSK